MKKILLSIITISSLAQAANSEFFKMNVSSETVGMANLTSGKGMINATFRNPASLHRITNEEGFEVNLLDMSVSGSSSFVDFAQDMQTAIDGTTEDILDVVKKYNGSNFNFNSSIFSSIAKKESKFTWGIGIFNTTGVNLQPHNGGSEGFIEAAGSNYLGITLNASKDWKLFNRDTVNVGVGVKYISSTTFRTNLSPTELLDNQNDLANYILDNYKKDNTYMTLDIGAIYDLKYFKNIKTSFGISILNLGEADSIEEYYRIPTTVNLGYTIQPQLEGKLALFNRASFSIDFNDIFFNQTMSSTVNNNTTLYADNDLLKRINYGVNVNLLDSKYFNSNINLGMYQNAYTAGINLRTAISEFSFTTYQEEISPEIGLLSDRRYIFSTSIKW